MLYRQPSIMGNNSALAIWTPDSMEKKKKSVFSIFVPYLAYVKYIVFLIVEGRNSNNLPVFYMNVIYTLTSVCWVEEKRRMCDTSRSSGCNISHEVVLIL